MQMSEFEKRSIIEGQLAEGHRNPDVEISEGELQSILTKKNQGRPFNPDLFEQLVEQLRRSGAPLTVRNFTDIWLQAESRLVASVGQMEGEIQSSVRERDELVEQKKKYANEQLNAYGIMNNSQLVVVVRSIENITRADGTRSNANFLLSCEGQSAETGNSIDPDLFNVNKTFKFNIQTGNDPLLINLVPTASNDPKDGGYIQIPLSGLNNQELQNQTYTFSTEYNQLMQTNADLQLQWIYSNVKLLNRGIQEMNDNIASKKRNKESAESYIEDLYAPFPPLKKTLKPKERTVAAGVYNPSTVVVNEKQFSKMPESAHSIFSKLLLYAIYVYLFISFLLCFHRCIFLDLLVALLLFSAVLLNQPKLIRSFINKVIGGVVLALLIDIVWLALYTRTWWNTTYQDSSSLLYVRRIMVVLSYAIMGVRLFVLVVLGVSYNDFGSGEDEFEMEPERGHAGQALSSQY
jgi:hypothetical protein